MARYTGPKGRLARRFGVALFGPSKELERRAYGPGQHGLRGVRRKRSDYAVALDEKQKLRYQYGILEKQFRGYFEEAARRRGVTGDILVQLLETRLDNVCYRLGFGATRDAARQFVGHGHVLVNGKRVNVPSFSVRPGDQISIRATPGSQGLAARLLEQSAARTTPDWLVMDKEHVKASVARLPEPEDTDSLVNLQLIVELYSR